MGIGIGSVTKALGGVGQFFGIGGGSDSGSGSGDAAAAEEARKDALRRRIDTLYGIGDDAAAKQLADERTQVSDSTRSYYADQLARSFGSAERNNRFNLARQGLLGGSANVDTNTELETDRTLGATRIDQAARAAAASLDAQREQERMGAIGLVNSGAGESAVSSAQAGLRNSLNQVSNTNKANLFGDLFSTGADAFASQNANAANAAMLARFQQQLGAYFPTKSSGGTVTPSG